MGRNVRIGMSLFPLSLLRETEAIKLVLQEELMCQ